MLWYRAAELKHSRVAMLACTGWLVNQYELYFPGNLAAGKAFSSLGKNPLEAWAATPYDGKVQILFAIGLAEFHSEFGKTAEGKGENEYGMGGRAIDGDEALRVAVGTHGLWRDWVDGKAKCDFDQTCKAYQENRWQFLHTTIKCRTFHISGWVSEYPGIFAIPGK